MFFTFKLRSSLLLWCIWRATNKPRIRSGLKQKPNMTATNCLFIVFCNTMFWPQPFSCHVDGTQINQCVCVRVRACVRTCFGARATRGPRLCDAVQVSDYLRKIRHTKITIRSTEYSDVRINNKVGTACRYWRLKDQHWDRYTAPLVIYYRRWHSFCRLTPVQLLWCWTTETQLHCYVALL